MLNCLGSSRNSVDPSPAAKRLPYPEDRKQLYEDVSKDAAPPIFKRTVPAPKQGLDSSSTDGKTKENPAMSFVMLTESQVVPLPSPANLNSEPPSSQASGPLASTSASQKLSVKSEQAERLFNILSSRSDIDHPICVECTELLLSSMSQRLLQNTKQRDTYIASLKSLQNSAPTAQEVSDARISLEKTKKAEAEAFQELQELEAQKRDLYAEIASLETESSALADEEQAFWASHNTFSTTLREFEEECDALNAAFNADKAQLNRLQRTNIYNDAFCISHDGLFATINGLRLGRLAPPNHVDWPEINAAWGCAVLLVFVVAEKFGFTFEGWRIRPMGSTSKIDKFVRPTVQGSPGQTQKSQSLDLFSSGDLPLGRLILHRRLDAGMVAFLDCLRQLGDFITHVKGQSALRNPAPSSPQSTSPMKPGGPSRNPTSNRPKPRPPTLSDQNRVSALPYPIQKDTINGVNIRLGASNDEDWSRACKYTLTCCKYLLAEASGWSGPRSSR